LGLLDNKDKPSSSALSSAITMAKKTGRLLKELAILLGHLSKRLIIFIAKQARAKGKPKAIQAIYLLKGLTLFVGRKLKTKGIPKAIQAAKVLQHYATVLAIKVKQVGKPKAIEAGQISKGLLILAGRNLKTKGIPKAIQAGQLLKSQFTTFLSKGSDKILEQASKALREDDITAYENHMKEDSTSAAITTTSAQVPSEIILEKEKRIELNERLAEEIVQNGIECKAIKDIGSLQIERSPYYSYLFPMSPRIVTNRGCIRLEDNESKRRNVSLIQIIQKN
jgi:hypothetical protein